MFELLKSINRNQQGISLLEILVAVAITGLIIGGIALIIIQLFQGHAQSSGDMTALQQVQNVGYRVSRDVEQANIILPQGTDDPDTTGGTDILTLYWTEFTEWTFDGEETVINSIKHKITYNLTDDRELLRYHYTTAEGEDTSDYPAIDGFENQESITPIARYISVCDYNQSNSVLTVTAETGGFQSQTETRDYEIDPRPDTIY